MAVLWEKEDVERFGDFFKRDMVDVVQLIGDDGVVGALISPYAGAVHVEASTDEGMISSAYLKTRLESEVQLQSDMGETEAVCSLRRAIHIVDEVADWTRNQDA